MTFGIVSIIVSIVVSSTLRFRLRAGGDPLVPRPGPSSVRGICLFLVLIYRDQTYIDSTYNLWNLVLVLGLELSRPELSQFHLPLPQEWEIFWPLSYGASVVTCTPGAERDPAYMVRPGIVYSIVGRGVALFLELGDPVLNLPTRILSWFCGCNLFRKWS